MVETLIEVLGVRACNFARFLFFKGGNLFEITEKLFVILYIKKEGSKEEESKPFMAKKGGKKKKNNTPLLGKELRLQLTEQDQLGFLDKFSRPEKVKLFLSLSRGTLLTYSHHNPLSSPGRLLEKLW